MRGAFVEVLKQMNIEDARRLAQHSPRQCVVLQHFHDEALMRVRSGLAQVVGPGVARRGHSSKVQNQVIRLVTVDEHASSLPWLSELRALHRKDHATLATALVEETKRVLAATASPGGLRIVHMLVGGHSDQRGGGDGAVGNTFGLLSMAWCLQARVFCVCVCIWTSYGSCREVVVGLD